MVKLNKAQRRAAKVTATKKVYLPDIIRGQRVTAFAQNVGYQILKHNIPDVWLETEGEGILIAVLDTGAQMDHVDLAASLVAGQATDPDSNTLNDGNGHGTHVSGIIAAVNNDQGIVGIAPKAKVLVIKVLADDGTGYLSAVVAGIDYAIANNVDIISMSLGAPEGDPTEQAAIQRAYAQNIPVICAAGNSGNIGQLAYPGRYPESISIGALNDQNIRAEWSQTGQMLDFMAPGVSILSTIPTNKYDYFSGTSMATPWAAGVVALMMAKHRKIGGQTPLNTVEDVREHLKKTAIDLAQAGKDPTTGFGLIDVATAIQEIKPKQSSSTSSSSSKAGEQPMATPFDGLTDKVNSLAAAFTAKSTQKDDLQNQINQLQGQLDSVTGEITALEDKATAINAILGP